MGKLLGFTEKSIKFVNLSNSGDYYDTYGLFVDELITHIKGNYSNCSDNIIKLLNRSLLKKLIMTVGYSIGSKHAYIDWVSTIRGFNFNEEDVVLLKKWFYIIFHFFKNGFVDKNILYLHSRDEFVNKLKKLSVFSLEDIQIPVSYYKEKVLDIRFKNENSISTIQYTATNYEELDEIKTDIAIFVNCIHALDASYLRRIILMCSDLGIVVGPIHDGFCIPFYTSNMFIYIANKAFFINEVDYIFGNINNEHLDKTSSSILL